MCIRDRHNGETSLVCYKQIGCLKIGGKKKDKKLNCKSWQEDNQTCAWGNMFRFTIKRLIIWYRYEAQNGESWLEWFKYAGCMQELTRVESE